MANKMQQGLRRDHTDHSSSENWFEKRQWSAKSNSEHGSGQKGLSSLQHPKKSNSLQVVTVQKGYRQEHAGKPSKHRTEALAHNRMNRTLSDPFKRGYRANRPGPKSEARPQSDVLDCSTFEVNLSDFPELSDITFSNLESPIKQSPQTCWGSVRSPALQDSPTTAIKDTSADKRLIESSQKFISTVKSSKLLTSTPGKIIGLVFPDSHGSSATSWANVASQPPKIFSKSPITHDASSQDEMGQLQSKQANQKKKKKKKKKCQLPCEEVEEETDNVMLQQDPPKFEDEEEFPDLSFASVNSKKELRNLPNPATNENLWLFEKEKSALQLENINKNKTPDGNPFSTGQTKVQQTSQKKSKALVQLDLGNMLTVLEQKQQSQKSKTCIKPLTLSVGGALPVVQKDPIIQKKHPRQQERIAHNPLDSTSPLVKKGKQRETPKAKKPSPLKRVILKEREERKQNRLLEERDPIHMNSEVSVNLSETSSAQQYEEPTSDQSGAEEADQTGSQVITEENASVKNWNSNLNSNRPKIHSRKFRDYCSQMLSKDVDECVTTLLKELVRFQDRLYQRDPIKARMKRRIVMGLREVLKHLKLRKVKCVIISPNCERVQSKGGLDEALHTIIDTCREQGVPFVFALSRKALGHCVNKAVPVSLVGIFNYDGAQDYYHKMIALTSQARKDYEVMITTLEDTSQEQPLDPPAIEEPEYIKIWKKRLEKDCNHKFAPFEEQFSSMAIRTDLDTVLNDHEKS